MLIFVTKQSLIKQVDGAEFDVAKRTIGATKLAEGDGLLFVGLPKGGESLVLQSEKQYFLRMPLEEVPEKRKSALGVRGMKLSAGETLTDAWLIQSSDNTAVEVGGKEIVLNRLRMGSRDSRGVKR